MNKNYLLLAVLVMLMNSSCIDSKKHMIRKLYGKTINLTWITDYVGQSEEFIGNSDNSYLIVTKIDSSFCTPCTVNYLKAAELFMEQLNNDDIGFICIIQPKSLVDLENDIKNLNLSKLLLVLDQSDIYSKVNHPEQYNSLMSSFLLNQDCGI